MNIHRIKFKFRIKFSDTYVTGPSLMVKNWNGLSIGISYEITYENK